MKRLPRIAWKKDQVLETTVSVPRSELRQLRWALCGAFSERAQLRAAIDRPGIDVARCRGDWSRREARGLFDPTWKYLWSFEALLIDLRAVTIVTVEDLTFTDQGFRFALSHAAVTGLTVPKREPWIESARWSAFSSRA